VAKTRIVSETGAMEACYEALRGLKTDEQERSLEWLRKKLGLVSPTVIAHVPAAPSGVVIPSAAPFVGDVPDPETFMTQKKPRSDIERVTCLAYYLARYRATKAFKTKGLTDLNTEAAQTKIGNATMAAANATKTPGYLTSAGGGKKQITPRGKALVEALPDPDAVTKALASHPARINRRRRREAPKKSLA
jgi:hypothetical protein